MSESGQPGAATPGEHGDGTGQQDDLARSVSGWAPPAAGWSRAGDPGREPAPVRRQLDPTAGWAASSTRHGDLPAPLAGLPAPEPPARVNGRPHVNGVRHAEEEPPVTRQAPVSAPPADEPRRDFGADRLVVPAQRPAPPGEQPAGDAETGPARHASDDPPAGHGPRWAEGTIPSSAPPAVQVPPVGTAPAGFEVPPGFHAPIVERGAPEPASSLSRGWADRRPPEPPVGEPADHPAGPADQPRWGAEPAEHRAGPVDQSRWGAEPAEQPAASADQPRWSAEPAERRTGSGEEPGRLAERRAPDEPEPAGPSWNQPSWGSGWAPPWPRDDEPGGRRARDDRAAEWAPEQTRPYEPVRAEPAPTYEPPRAEPARPYEVARTEFEPRPPYEREHADRPSWAGGAPAATPFSAPPHTAPTSAPPVPREAPASAPPYAAPTSVAPAPREAPGSAPAYAGPASVPPTGYDPPPAGSEPAAVRSAEERTVRPFRLRSEAEKAPATPPAGAGGHPPPPAGPGPATATSGVARFDRAPAPAPTSAPPYAARRSAPEPVPTAEPVADSRPDDAASAMLPQRVPAEPDVPVVPEPPAVEPSAETPELARIATHLRRDDEPAPLRERPEGFDVNAILDAVREVAGVRDAALRRTPAGAHSLRLDLADGADPAEVSRQVARLLQDRMGLAAAPQNLPGMPASPPPPVRRRSVEGRAEHGGAEERAAAARPGPARAAPAAESRPGQQPQGRAGRPADASAGAPEGRNEPRAEPEAPRRRRQVAPHRGRAPVDETSLAAAPAGTPTGSPAMLGTSYSGGQMTTTETAPSRPLDTGGAPGPRVVIDHVQVSTFGLDATVEVRLIAGDATAEGHATGPAVDGYVLRLCAVAAASAVDELLRGAAQPADRGRCFVEHTAVVPFGNCEVATVVVLLVCDGWVEQLAGSALVAGDPRSAVVRATLAAVNRRLEALLA